MNLFKDTGTVLLVVAAAGGTYLPIKVVEKVSAMGGCETGNHFKECLRQLEENDFVVVSGKSVRMSLHGVQKEDAQRVLDKLDASDGSGNLAALALAAHAARLKAIDADLELLIAQLEGRK